MDIASCCVLLLYTSGASSDLYTTGSQNTVHGVAHYTLVRILVLVGVKPCSVLPV